MTGVLFVVIQRHSLSVVHHLWPKKAEAAPKRRVDANAVPLLGVAPNNSPPVRCPDIRTFALLVQHVMITNCVERMIVQEVLRGSFLTGFYGRCHSRSGPQSATAFSHLAKSYNPTSLRH